jgi:hypothetical protein
MKDQRYSKDALRKLPQSTISSKIAFDGQTLCTMSDLVDEILRWANITSKIDDIRDAYTKAFKIY